VTTRETYVLFWQRQTLVFRALETESMRGRLNMSNEFSTTYDNAKLYEEVASHLGVAHSEIQLLVDDGLLHRPSARISATLSRATMVTGQSVTGLLQHLAGLETEADGRTVIAFDQVVDTAQFPY